MSDLIYVDADGNEVPEGDPRAVRQYRSDDENRPKAKKPKVVVVEEAEPEPAAKAISGPPENKARTAPKATK